MLSKIGFIFLIISFLCAFLNVLAYFDKKFFLKKFFYFAVYLGFASILISFLTLVLSYAVSDFSNFNVFQNSHSSKPLLYKISGSWGNHEGSMLLWILIIFLYSFLFSFNRNLEDRTKKLTLVFQSLIFLFFCSFVIFSSNPFLIIYDEFKEGMGLNPILQDPALAIHPPLLYLGYVGFSLILSLALSGLYHNKINKEWLKTTKQWSIFCWSMLTAGITFGSYWAYYELGWGGWWFWDPVENVSLMPWIAGLALVHSLMIVEQEQMLKRWIVFLSILCFSLSILGTFLVRSGILTSVHAFANDSARGIFILMIFLIITSFSFLVFFIKSKETKGRLNLLFINKTSALLINNIVMTTACATILLGTIYPIIIEVITDKRISVGSPYYNSTVLPILLPGFLLMSIAPALSWKTNSLEYGKYYIYFFIILSLLVLFASIFSSINPWGFVGIFTGMWIILTSSYLMIRKQIKINNISIYNFLKINNSLIAHMGVGILIIGATCSSVFQQEFQKKIQINEKLKLGNYELKLNNIDIIEKENYQTLKGDFELYKEEEKIANIHPEKRYYHVSKIITTEAGIYHSFFQDFYITLGERENDFWIIKYYQNPLVSLIWLGAFIMFLSGLISLRK